MYKCEVCFSEICQFEDMHSPNLCNDDCFTSIEPGIKVCGTGCGFVVACLQTEIETAGEEFEGELQDDGEYNHIRRKLIKEVSNRDRITIN